MNGFCIFYCIIMNRCYVWIINVFKCIIVFCMKFDCFCILNYMIVKDYINFVCFFICKVNCICNVVFCVCFIKWNRNLRFGNCNWFFRMLKYVRKSCWCVGYCISFMGNNKIIVFIIMFFNCFCYFYLIFWLYICIIKIYKRFVVNLIVFI